MRDTPIRVLQIVTYMPKCGLETMIMNYYRHINRSKIQFDFLEHRQESTGYDWEIESLGGRIFRLPKINPFSLEYRRKLDLFFKEHKEYKIVHCHMNFMSGLPLLYAEKNRIPVRIAHIHSTNMICDIKYPIRLYYRKKMIDSATDFFACGEAAGKWAYGTKDFIIMKNAVDRKKFQFSEENRMLIRKKLKLSDQLVIGHVGRFAYPKNHLFIIDIFKYIVKMDNQSVLLLVGDGELKEKIYDKVKREGLEKNVIFYGSANNVGQIMAAMDVFLLPSLYEGLPVTLVEAQYAGLQCFISDKVPRESILADRVCQLNLDMPAEKWAEIIMNKANYPRDEKEEVINGIGYDIEENVRWLEEEYSSMLRNSSRKEETIL